MNISKSVRIAFTIIGLITIVLAFILFLTNINVPFVSKLTNLNNNDADMVVNDEEAPVIEDFLKVAEEVTFEELKSQNPDLTGSTVIVDTEDREKFVEDVLKNREPVVHDVLILPEGITSRAMFVSQGDYIRFANELTRSITVQNLTITDEASRETVIDSKDGRTFGFDIIGEFTFDVDGTEFKVFVEKYVQE